jgi:hypothetical protein
MGTGNLNRSDIRNRLAQSHGMTSYKSFDQQMLRKGEERHFLVLLHSKYSEFGVDILRLKNLPRTKMKLRYLLLSAQLCVALTPSQTIIRPSPFDAIREA